LSHLSTNETKHRIHLKPYKIISMANTHLNRKANHAGSKLSGKECQR